MSAVWAPIFQSLLAAFSNRRGSLKLRLLPTL